MIQMDFAFRGASSREGGVLRGLTMMYPAVLPDNMDTSRTTLGGNSKNLLANHVLTSGGWLNVQVY